MNKIRPIPKKIHYFWFGKKEKSELAMKCINSWSMHLSGFEIKEWNEENFDVYSCRYSAEAFESGKYAFVSDYARLKVLFEHGGFYLDTDVELLKDLDDLRYQEAFMGFETDDMVGPGAIIGAREHNAFIGRLADMYSRLQFNYNGHLNLTTIGEYATALLLRRGLRLNGHYQKLADINIYSRDAFCPYDRNTGKLNITDGTYSIHHFEGSWKEAEKPETDQKLQRLKQRTKLLLLAAAGEQNFFRIRYLLG